MLSVQEAIDALKVALQKKDAESHVQDAFSHLASCLVLLNSSSPSVQMIRKLCTVLRQPLLPLYNACLQPTLWLSSSVLSTVLGKLCDAHDAEDERLRAAWGATAEVILSGVLDFLDQKDGGNIEPDGTVWEVLYRIICEFFFLDSGRGLPVSSIPLCLSAYNTLTEIATKHITIRNALRDSSVLGGERLGAAMSRTRDYLLLEALLMLFARLLPPFHNTSEGKFRRVKFVKEVLGSQKLFKCSAELLDIMRRTSGTHWDEVAAQIIDALARSDITYPQPFAIDEIDVCGHVFPQPLATDRLIMDKQAFLANIVVDNDDLCESLQVPYSHIHTITLDNSEKNIPKGKVSTMVYLTSAPLVADIELKPSGGSHLYAKFLLPDDAVGRFMEALRRRGVGKLSFLNPLTKVQRKRKSISIGSGFKFIDDSSPIPPTASFEGKIQHVNKVYKTNIEDSTTSEAVSLPYVGDAGSPMHHTMPASKDDNLVPTLLGSAAVNEAPATPKNPRFISPTNETSKSVQNFSLSFSPGNSTKAIQLFGDDELSDISEFEPDDITVGEPVVTGIDCMRMNGSSSATSALEIKKSFESTSKTKDSTERAASRSCETEKSMLTSDSPLFGSSSSTQIDIPSKSLSHVDPFLTAIDTGADGGLPDVSRDFVGVDRLKKTGKNECGPSDTALIIAPAGKPQIGFSSAEDESRKHGRRFTSSSGANQKVTKDMSAPPKISGSRRKSEAIIEVDDESAPPRKKSRDDGFETNKDNVKSNETSLSVPPISRLKKYTKTARGSTPRTVDLDELPELKSTCRGTRRSSRIKKRQTASTGRTRANATCGKPRKRMPADDISIKISHDTPPPSNSPPNLFQESPLPNISSHVPLVELSAKSITPETSLPRKMLKASDVLPCEPNQPAKESWEDLDFVQQPANATQFVEELSHIKIEGPMNDQHLVSSLRTIDNDLSRVKGIVEYSVSLKESEPSGESPRPITESTPRTKTVTIDLTVDNSPAQEENELRKASIDLERSEADIQMKFKTFEQSKLITVAKPALVPSPRHRRRSVTFASPVEHVLYKKVKPKTLVDSPSRRSASPCESNTLSPLKIPAGAVNMKCGSPDRVTPRATLQNSKLLQAHVQAPMYNRIPHEVEIQDIVEVLDEIQAVIIKGISNKFRNIRKDVRHGRDELLQQVVGELQGMGVENATYFNGLVRLEEDYYKNGTTITRCWEELINCSDATTVQFENALKEHDENVSSRIFPKSLLPLQPVFLYRRGDA